MILASIDVLTMVAVRNLGKSKKFFENKLDITYMKEMPDGIEYKSNNGMLYVYQSEFSGSLILSINTTQKRRELD